MDSIPGYPYYLAIHREGRLKGQAPESIKMIPNLKREWDRGGFGTGHRTREFKGTSIQEVFDKLQAEGINPRYDEVDFYEVRAPNSPRRGLNRQQVFSMLESKSINDNIRTAQEEDDNEDLKGAMKDMFEDQLEPTEKFKYKPNVKALTKGHLYGWEIDLNSNAPAGYCTKGVFWGVADGLLIFENPYSHHKFFMESKWPARIWEINELV